MTNEKLRVGIIGIGIYATLAHAPALRDTGKAEVVAICRRNTEKLAVAQKQLGIAEAYTDWRTMLRQSRLDAVVVSTPHDLHAEPAIAALEQGLHVLVEKPMTLTQHDAQRMIAAAEHANRVLMVGYDRRFSGLWRAVKQILTDNSIGQIRQINLQFAVHRRWYWDQQGIPEAFVNEIRQALDWPDKFVEDLRRGLDWHASPLASGGGMFSNTGAHFVDLILWLAGAPPVEVVAFSDALGMPAECLLNIQARLANGVLVSMTSADVPAGGVGGQGQLTIIGDDGILTHDFTKPMEVWLHRDAEVEQVQAVVADISPAAAFVATITEGAPNLCPPQEAIHAVAFTQSAYRSAAERRIVQMSSDFI